LICKPAPCLENDSDVFATPLTKGLLLNDSP
jgi:hypothetical protein